MLYRGKIVFKDSSIKYVQYVLGCQCYDIEEVEISDEPFEDKVEVEVEAEEVKFKIIENY